jgi:hypothetical protein
MHYRILCWLEEHAPPWAVSAWAWPHYRLFSRCLVCGRPMVLHTPWALYVCERTSLPIEITEQGMARYAELVGEHVDPAA